MEYHGLKDILVYDASQRRRYTAAFMRQFNKHISVLTKHWGW